MRITQIEINHLHQPLGFQLPELVITALVSGESYPKLQRRLTIQVDDRIVYQTAWQAASDLTFHVTDLTLTPRTRYQVLVQLKAPDQQTWQQTTWFETGLLDQPLAGQWIGSSRTDLHGIELSKTITVPKGVQNGRLYMTGLGLYEAYLDGHKIGDEYLAPGFTNYNYYVQVATYDVTALLQAAGQHQLTIRLADGWYRGKIGLSQHGGTAAVYGNTLMANAELHYQDAGGVDQRLVTDTSWHAQLSPVTHAGIYYGEDFDATQPATTIPTTSFPQPSKYVVDRLSLPITAHEQLPVKQVITTPRGETVLDFGQNFAGWVTFRNRLPKGAKVSLEFGELMQHGEFYRDNLRSARASFTYVSDGRDGLVRPHFTYFGFRYVRVTDFPSIDPADFTGIALYSDMPMTGQITTDRADVNQLFRNIQWGQKSNFLDVPTDCPQRDERLGWTGDAAIFAKTASYNMDTYQFFTKYSFDMAVEQSLHQGKLTLYAPAVDQPDGGKAVWSDAATIIPWTMYQRTGDTTILTRQFGAMASWVDWIRQRTKTHGQEFLWLDDEQLGDWLALDTEDIMHLKGRTPDDLIASAYYYYSASIVAQAAQVLHKQPEATYYQDLAKHIKQAFLAEFFTASGRLITQTQTGLALCLTFDLVPVDQTVALTKQLAAAVAKHRNHLTTGFVGTPALLPALSANGQHDLAVDVFLNESFPGWLSEVQHGATTIWERWDSIQADGTINDNGMNSLNHYSAGAVMQWAYEYLVGIQAGVDARHVTIRPGINAQLRQVSGQTRLATGTVKVAWQLLNATGSQVQVKLTIPYGAAAKARLPRATTWTIDGQVYANGSELPAGDYRLTYQPQRSFLNEFSVQTQLVKYNQQTVLTKKLSQVVPFWEFLTLPGNMANFEHYSLMQLSAEMRGIGFTPFTAAQIDQINQIFTDFALAQAQEEEPNHA
ncbi:alfa-L-rhamnosidase [Lactobacillus coryniformis subsp. coryniformis KCTC 3167 = DSM] [Lactiplantibacillus mudanjiangensis]|uniref:family 78 glycoside hydrolase catalytic domain n=1 Tax=Lactiplantibacillus mudanjiangensis TaxID=1296538 RepID=UPI0010156A56|nr:family 78 glycoside hydrolase catalytic domain [Lactiplantibacillus mudanjiangensis]VDG33646.1 alfa-L-rhamnosidase [Lactobacillus coryniformis subsp. coryniformis KCTC 3167 = DSM] [Lactiplantibacillus mudanjiangensis]